MLTRLHPTARRVLLGVAGVTTAVVLNLTGTDLEDIAVPNPLVDPLVNLVKE